MQTIPENVSHVTQLLVENNYEAFLVGGCVRDMAMNKNPKDYDIATNATPEQIITVFETTELRVVYENSFGTVSIVFEHEPLDSNVREIQITPYRTEGNYTDHRHPDSVSFSTNIHDDLSRRDFTINAIASSGMSGESFIDPFHGVDDINKKIIQCVGNPGERFTEDALRIMRCIRFAAQLNFAVSRETLDAILETKHLLQNISIERIRDEFVKIIDSENPGMGMFLMKQLGILEIILPEIIPAIGCVQGGVHIYDVYDHLVHACQHAANKKYSFHVKLAALFHDIGKPKTRRPGIKKAYTFYGHEVVGARITQKIMERMKFSSADIDQVVTLVRWHMFFSDTETITLSPVRRMIANVKHLEKYNNDVSQNPIWTLMQIRECDRVGMNKVEAPYRLRKYFAMIEECLRDPISVSQLVIDGDYLMNLLHVKPGPRMGWMLHAMLEEVLEHPEKNTLECLSDRVKHYETLDDSTLRNLGTSGKEKKEIMDRAVVKQLHTKHGVHKKHV